MNRYYSIAKNRAELTEIVIDRAENRAYIMEWGSITRHWTGSEAAAKFLESYWDEVAQEQFRAGTGAA